MTRWKNLTEEEKNKYGKQLKEKESNPENYNDYYLVIYEGKHYWIYHPDVDWIDYL